MNLRYILLFGGIIFVLAVSVAFILRKMTPVVALIWIMFSGVMILFGIMPFWGMWLRKVNPVLPLPLVVMIFLVLAGLLWTSIGVSKLIDRNRELSMQIGLLNKENERIIEILREMGKDI